MIKVLYVGPMGQRTGYARAGHDICLALKRTPGVNLAIRPMLNVDEDWFPSQYEELLPHVNRPEAMDPIWPDVVLSHSVPFGCALIIEELDFPQSTPRIAITTWETDKLGASYAQSLVHNFNQVWVPSVFCKESLVAGGVPAEGVKVVPHCYDPAFYTAKEPAREKDEPYHFYTILTWSWRKGYFDAILAYVTEFKEKDNVVLKVKTPGYSQKEMASLARGLNADGGSRFLPPIDMVCDNFSEQQMKDFHQDNDCYISAAKAEGWGLGAFEAVVTGNPVIYTDYSGVRDFLTGMHGAVPVNYTMGPAYTPELLSDNTMDVDGMKVRPVLRNAPIGIDVLEENWANIDVCDLKQKMRAAYESKRVLSEEQIYENRAMLTARFSYDVVGLQMKKLMEEMVRK